MNNSLVNNKDKPQTLEGLVERVTFHNEQTGFCVLRTKVKGQQDLITVVGNLAAISPGEYIDCQGFWINDKNFGLQFRAQTLKTTQPTTLEGMEKYLGSGLVRGIGPFFAKKIIKAFGNKVFDIIDTAPQELTKIDGIGNKRKNLIIASWAEQKSIRAIMVFLQSYGIGTARSVRIFKTYGDEAISKIKENPYILASDIRGIGFKTADELAYKLGINKDSLIRAQAGVSHVLQEYCSNGHCAAPYDLLVKLTHELLTIPINIITQAIKEELLAERLKQDNIQGEDCIYLISFYEAEIKAAKNLKRLKQGEPPWGQDIWHPKIISWLETQTNIQLSPSQQQALQTVLQAKLSIITGGPGVGKTTLVNSLLKIIKAKKMIISLCAPTGRAAKRLQETTTFPAKTIHRLLEFEPQNFGFKYNQHNPLPLDVLIIDESSMLDITLLHQLLRSIPSHAALIFVGDIDQLPSVGPGSVLADLIKSETIATVRLTEIFRQANCSKIIVNAHRVNKGLMPLPNENTNNDFFTIYANEVEEIHEKLVQIVATRLPKFYNCNPIKDIQVLTPMHRGSLGSRSLNQALQQELNSKAILKVARYGTTFSIGDKVIQMSNNYKKEVFNGDIGFIEQIDQEDGLVGIRFDQNLKEYEINELDEVSLAYAISIHKSQGSEFPIVVIPLVTQHYTLLARNLLYTAITRSKKVVVLIGQKKAVAIAVRNNKSAIRLTKLAERLR